MYNTENWLILTMEESAKDKLFILSFIHYLIFTLEKLTLDYVIVYNSWAGTGNERIESRVNYCIFP
jgi:hypothetical protein